MPSSRRLALTPEAESDLAAIWRYGAAMWDEVQADRYAERIWSTLANLAHFPGLGRSRDELAEGLRSFPVGEHIVFYRVTDDEVIVRRVIHHGRDVTAELGE